MGGRGCCGGFWGGIARGGGSEESEGAGKEEERRGLGKEQGRGLGEGKQWVKRTAWVQRVAVQMGVHLAFWPCRVQWGTRAKTREVGVLGNEILRRVEAGEEKWVMERYLKSLVDGGNRDV